MVRGERQPGRDDRRVVWFGGGVSPDAQAGQTRRQATRVEMGLLKPGVALPAEATHWTGDGLGHWIRVPGA